MKYVVVLPDGAADEPVEQLSGRTPLEVAATPQMDWVARNGQLGRAVTIPEGFEAGTDVGSMTLLGYDPATNHTGRAPLEAAAKGLTAKPGELIFRCNFVTVENGLMVDYTGGHTETDEAQQLIAALNEHFAGGPLKFHVGVAYRNLLIAPGQRDDEIIVSPPHNIPNQPVKQHLPRGASGERIKAIVYAAAPVVRNHPVNQRRAEQGRRPVTGIWLWGQGPPTKLVPFQELFGLKAAVITGVDLIRGLARCMGLTLIEVPGATGYIETNFEGKGQYAVGALKDYDMIVVHVEAPDEAGHEGNAAAKVTALEKIDRYVVGPLLEAVQSYGDWRMLVAADHPTPIVTQAHSSVPPLFAYAGTGVASNGGTAFDDPAAVATGLLIDPGHTLMQRLLRG